MGTTNHGTQIVAVGYFMDALSGNQNKTTHNIIVRGIYNGGYLTRVSDSEVTLSPFTVSIGDSTYQVSVTSSANATVNNTTLDSGTISAATPYLVMRWSYAAVVNNYVEIHAIANVAAALTNDIIIGKCVFAGATLTSFDYSNRTNPVVANKFLKVEAEDTPSMYVRIKGGIVQIGSAYVNVADQLLGPFSAPSAPNSRIDLIYINITGVSSILAGTAAVSPTAPSYAGKLVVAEITIANGTASITNSLIRDVRAFLCSSVIPDDLSLQFNATSGKLEVKDPFNAIKYDSGWFTVAKATSYTRTHNLGSYLLSIIVLFAPDSGGSPDLTKITEVTKDLIADWTNFDVGCLVQDVNTTQLSVVTGSDYVAFRTVANGTTTRYTSGHYRILAVKIA